MKTSYSILLILGLLALGCGGGGDDEPSSNPDNIVFQNEPPSDIDHNRPFNYQPSVRDINGKPVTIEIGAVPGWLNLDEESLRLTGTPDWPRLNTAFRLNVMATNGVDTAYQRSDIKIRLGEILCGSGFGNPEESEYILPFESGKTFNLINGNCPTNPNWGHQKAFAYDFNTPMGTDIIAMRGGTVIVSVSHHPDIPDCSVGGGNIVFIQHSDGSVAFYGHFRQNSVVVKVGDRVEQGDLLAKSGNSGCSAGPHVHVQIYRQRGPYDRQYSLPFNFSNSDGPLSGNRSLIIGRDYSAL